MGSKRRHLEEARQQKIREELKKQRALEEKQKPVEKKVVYEPVKLAQEYRDFDYTSPWEGMPKGIDDHNEQELIWKK